MTASETKDAFVGRWLFCSGPSGTSSRSAVGLELRSDGRLFPLIEVDGRVVVDPFSEVGGTYTIDLLDEPPGARWRFAVTVTPLPGPTWLEGRSVAYFLDNPRRLVWSILGQRVLVRSH
jgi:hypothetical protein